MRSHRIRGSGIQCRDVVGDPEDADRSAVLALVTEYFSNPETDGNGAFAGPVREWIELYPEPTSSVTRVVHERELEHAEIVELTADRAVVEVRARFSWRLIRGTWSREYSSRGPTELCKLDGTWRIVDYDADGQSAHLRRRSSRETASGLPHTRSVIHRSSFGRSGPSTSPSCTARSRPCRAAIPPRPSAATSGRTIAYRYGPPAPASLRHVLVIRIGCDVKTWRVYSWI
jgi:hypothetical protein